MENTIETLTIKIEKLNEQIKALSSIEQTPDVVSRIAEFKNEVADAQLKIIDIKSEQAGLITPTLKIKRFWLKSHTVVFNLFILGIGALDASTDIISKQFGDNSYVKFLLLVLPSITIFLRMYKSDLTVKRD